jgi:hypothetical protein
VITGNLIMFAALTIIEIEGTLRGALNWVGWLFIIVDSLFVVGYLWLLKKIMG